VIGASTCCVDELKRRLEQEAKASAVWKVGGCIPSGTTASAINIVALVKGDNLTEKFDLMEKLESLTGYSPDSEKTRVLVDHLFLWPVFSETENEGAFRLLSPRHSQGGGADVLPRG